MKSIEITKCVQMQKDDVFAASEVTIVIGAGGAKITGELSSSAHCEVNFFLITDPTKQLDVSAGGEKLQLVSWADRDANAESFLEEGIYMPVIVNDSQQPNSVNLRIVLTGESDGSIMPGTDLSLLDLEAAPLLAPRAPSPEDIAGEQSVRIVMEEVPMEPVAANPEGQAHDPTPPGQPVEHEAPPVREDTPQSVLPVEHQDHFIAALIQAQDNGEQEDHAAQ